MHIHHILLPDFKYNKAFTLPQEYSFWLERNLEYIHQELSIDSIAISNVINGILSELILYNELRTDWLNITKELLEYEETPITYSRVFGKKLYKFDRQWMQTDVITLYNHKFIMDIYNIKNFNYRSKLQEFIHNNGYIFNPNVSNTNPRTRMKSEILMSLAIATELLDYDEIPDATSSLIRNFEQTNFVAAEYFKVIALKNLKCSINNYKDVHNELLNKCFVNPGYADFSVEDKLDDYMGTKKRIGRDKAVASPLITLYANVLAQNLDEDLKNIVVSNIDNYVKYLTLNPLDIQAYKMRDLHADFGSSITPFEIFSYYILKNR